MWAKSITYFLMIFIKSRFSELDLLNTCSKSDFNSSKDILISGEFINPRESNLLMSKSSSSE